MKKGKIFFQRNLKIQICNFLLSRANFFSKTIKITPRIFVLIKKKFSARKFTSYLNHLPIPSPLLALSPIKVIINLGIFNCEKILAVASAASFFLRMQWNVDMKLVIEGGGRRGEWTWHNKYVTHQIIG